MALGTAVLWGAADFLGGLKSRVASTVAVVGGSQLAGLVPVAVVVAATQMSPPGDGRCFSARLQAPSAWSA